MHGYTITQRQQLARLHGTVQHNGEEMALTHTAELDTDHTQTYDLIHPVHYYSSVAVSDDGEVYKVRWDLLPMYAALDAEGKLAGDDEDMCDWETYTVR